jgi:hypothetical protein
LWVFLEAFNYSNISSLKKSYPTKLDQIEDNFYSYLPDFFDVYNQNIFKEKIEVMHFKYYNILDFLEIDLEKKIRKKFKLINKDQ